jgi:hypothetical protein
MTDTLEKLSTSDPRVAEGTALADGSIALRLAPGWLNARLLNGIAALTLSDALFLLNRDARSGYLARPPRAERYNPDCEYLHNLIARAGLDTEQVAQLAGLTSRSLRNYLNPEHDSRHPYLLQWMLETLADPHGSRGE